MAKENRTFKISESPEHLIESYQSYRRGQIKIEQLAVKLTLGFISIMGSGAIGLVLYTARHETNLGAIDLTLPLLSLLVILLVIIYWQHKKLDKKYEDLMNNDFFQYLTKKIIRGEAEESDGLIMVLRMMKTNNLKKSIYSSKGYDIVLIREY